MSNERVMELRKRLAHEQQRRMIHERDSWIDALFAVPKVTDAWLKANDGRVLLPPKAEECPDTPCTEVEKIMSDPFWCLGKSKRREECPDTPVHGYREETWVSMGDPVAHYAWMEEKERCIASAQQRLRSRIVVREDWPLCPACGKPRKLVFDVAETETDSQHRRIYAIRCSWSCK